MIFAVVAPAHAARGKENNKYAAMVIDSETGQVLFERNGDKAVYPASLTKVMTLLLLFEALEAGQVRLNDRIPVSAHAAAAPPSKLGLRVGSTIKVKDAIYAMVTKSANDVAVAVGEFLGGSEARFAQIMTSRARQLGMRGTTFRNASGLHNPAQTTTARDMIVLARTVIRQYPDYYRYFSTQNFTYNGHSYNNHNRLMGKYPGMDGMKTGYVNASGFNLVASAVRDDKRLIAVVFGGRTANSRNAEMRKILDASFARINQTSSGIRVASASETFAPKPVVRDVVDAEDMPNMAMVEHSAGQKQGALNPMIGQGDFDPGMVRRMNAGLLAIAAHQGMQKQNPVVRPAQRQTQRSLVTPVVSSASARGSKDWSIQIGAFNSRVASEESTARALGKLPAVLRHGQPAVAPMKTNKGWLYRARLSGYTQAQANVACRYLRDCIPVAPIR
ncbi:MAG: D-alanyl-D-alanine carboxypeptidase [Alphaproteobacteria bacterium]|nr:D-alanyl-D-alanine carboxypeptidase [Alphaproteobacteria bacterium]